MTAFSTTRGPTHRRHGTGYHRAMDHARHRRAARDLQAANDISRAYGAGASGFVTKPMDADALFESIRCIENFWFGLAELPL